MHRPAPGATLAQMAELVAIGYPDETSALAAEKELGRYGETMLTTSLSKEAERKLQSALHGAEDREPVTA
jgi:uncharacterized membrane protein